MKKALMVILALVMALTLIMGLVSTASAAKPIDTGWNQLSIDIFSTSGPAPDQSYDWNLICTDSYAGTDFTRINGYTIGMYPDYDDDVNSSINWRKGIARFTNNELDLTVTFSPSEITQSGTGKNVTTSFWGDTAHISGWIYNETYVVDADSDRIHIEECHQIPEPEPSLSYTDITYDFSSDPYVFDITGINWQNVSPYYLQVRAATESVSHVSDYYMVPKGRASKYPQDYQIVCSFPANDFEYAGESLVNVSVILLDRNFDPIFSQFVMSYVWGVGVED